MTTPKPRKLVDCTTAMSNMDTPVEHGWGAEFEQWKCLGMKNAIILSCHILSDSMNAVKSHIADYCFPGVLSNHYFAPYHL